MRNLLRRKQDKQPAPNAGGPSSSAAQQTDTAFSPRRPSETSLIYTQRTSSDGDAEEFFDDASTIRPTRSYAGSVFSDTASTLQEDMYACLGPQDSSSSSSGTTSAAASMGGRGSAAHASSAAVARQQAGGSSAAALGTIHAARGSGSTTVPRAYWHEPRDLEPFNPFEEVARLSQRERVELALKNANGPQYRELKLNGGYSPGLRAAKVYSGRKL